MSAPGQPPPPAVAIVHDYLTQRGGAERLVLELASAFPGAPVYTSLYDPAASFPELAALQVCPLPLNRLGPLRHRHRLALPLLAPAFSRLRVEAQVALCSSSGWAHGARTSGRKVVYCHTPARWLYQTSRYLGARGSWAKAPFQLLAVPLRRWDASAAASAHRYVVNSSVVRERVRAAYGRDAEVLPPPPGIGPGGPTEPVPGLDAGFFLCISRLLEYKNVQAVVEAFERLPGEQLVVVGAGPLLEPLRRRAQGNVCLLGAVPEAQLRWLYQACAGVVAASYEDFGLTPVEGLTFGKPTAALRFGGFLDTVVEGATGYFFEQPEPEAIAEAVRRLASSSFPPAALAEQAAAFSRERFRERLHEIVGEELALA